MRLFLLTFIPLFVAVDAMGVLPMYLGLTEGIDRRRNRTIVIQSVLTALVVGTVFLLIGKSVLKVLGITIADFMIAGGVILFLLSVGDLASLEKRPRQTDNQEIGPVPVGVPLIVGPAVLTTGLLLIDEYGMLTTILALGLNVIIAGILFWLSPFIARVLGKVGAKIISKLSALLLASFAIMMIRRGVVQNILEQLR